jgi:hypothetical protein
MRTQPASATESLSKKDLLSVLNAFKRGDFSVRMPLEAVGIDGKIADTLNDVIELNERMTKEFARISSAVGKEGRIAQRANLGGIGGGWNACVESLNSLIADVV